MDGVKKIAGENMEFFQIFLASIRSLFLLTEDVFVEEDFTLDWLLDEVMVEGGEGGVHDEGDQEEKQRKRTNTWGV